MKTIWNIMSILAIANLVAMAMIGGWLAASGRLNGDRFNEAKSLFSSTIMQDVSEQAVADQAAQDIAEDAEAQALLTSLGEGEIGPGEPIDAANLLNVKLELSEIDLQRQQRLERDLRTMSAQLAMRENSLNDLLDTIKQRQLAFEDQQKEIKRTLGSKQFKKTLATLSEMKPKTATRMILSMQQGAQLVAGSALDNDTQVLAILNGLEDDFRAQILSEILSTDEKLAGRLLHGLQTFGQRVPTTGVMSDASAPDPAGPDPF